MASCKDCVHVEVCCEKNLHVAVGMNIIPRFKYKRIEQECKHFKDRSLFVALPCKVGDTIYVVGKGKVMQDSVVAYFGDDEETFQFDGIKTDGYFSDFGKTVFLTREAAEQALKERESNDNHSREP